MKRTLIYSAVVAALGGLLFGFDTAVISGTTGWLELVFQLTPAQLGFTVASALIGTIIGALFVGKPTDRYGRRFMLFILALLYFISALGSSLAWDWYSFLLFRLIGGLGVGGASVVSPMYIAEISPAQYRGRMVAVAQLNIVFGMLLAYFSNYLIVTLDIGPAEWRWMFGVEAIPAALFFIFLFTTPRSPRWLVARGLEGEARQVIEMCGSDSGSVSNEIAIIKCSLHLENQQQTEPFFTRKYRFPIYLAVMLALFNQLSGINAVLYYAPVIFDMAGFEKSSALLNTIGVGSVFLIFTLAAMAVIDRIGRKKLMIYGSIGYILSLSATAWAFFSFDTDISNLGKWVVLGGLFLFIASHAFGQGSVIWVYLSEIFPNRVRARGQALGTTTHWIAAAFISWTFPLIADFSGGYAFTFYAICMVGQLLWVIFSMKETKGISLEEIQHEMGIQ
ncbi:sugar porter family MFS transporter [Mangrovibacterium diazotrophicum]|uniref:Sugar porter (SP) family MFS transporter n=1 Tax=Mangrovibacterium diazotrophicum TaxID=1261403 RepID=A0A419VYR9_9BACT|nr:sugar porter family MFS transporter [Mangrovibacterium diazotrophicum]RKD88299.1 sugar porter (SP) family MFS transporter [Mangrovibacterium diazotrophicum]